MTLSVRSRAALALALATAAVVLVSALSDILTRPRIAAHQRDAAMRQINEILQPVRFDNRPANDVMTVSDPDLLGGPQTRRAFRAFFDDEPVAVVLETVAPGGYSGPIALLVGIDADGRVTGVRVTMHRETRGLGDRIELAHDNWILSFDGRALGDPPRSGWRVQKYGGEFDQFTGATITPSAVVRAVRDALIYFRRHRDELLAAPPSGNPPP